MLSSEVMGLSMIHAPANCYGQGIFFCFNDCRHIIDNETTFPTPTLPHEKKQSRQEALKRILKNCGKDAEV